MSLQGNECALPQRGQRAHYHRHSQAPIQHGVGIRHGRFLEHSHEMTACASGAGTQT